MKTVVKNRVSLEGMRFVYNFQGVETLWEVGEQIGENRRACRIVNGIFVGKSYNSMYVGQEVAFEEDHLAACVALDSHLARVSIVLGRMEQSKESAGVQAE